MKKFKVEHVINDDGTLSKWYKIVIYKDGKRYDECRTQYHYKSEAERICLWANLNSFLCHAENIIFGIKER